MIRKKRKREKGKTILTTQLGTFIILPSFNWFLSYLNSDCLRSPSLIVRYYVCVDFVFTFKVERTLRTEIQSFTSLYRLLPLYLAGLIGIAWSGSVLIFVSNKILKSFTILEFCVWDHICIHDLKTRGIWLVTCKWKWNSFKTEPEIEFGSSDPSSTPHLSAPSWLISLVPFKAISDAGSLKIGSGHGVQILSHQWPLILHHHGISPPTSLVLNMTSGQAVSFQSALHFRHSGTWHKLGTS